MHALSLLSLALVPLLANPHPADGLPLEGRAVWNHSGTGAYPGDWERSAKLLSESGFNMVLPNMLWGGLAHYPSDVLPRSPVFRKHGDQVQQCCAAAKRHGLQVHVWKVNFNLTNAPKDFVARLRREGRTQVSAKGQPYDWLCPSHPENQKLELESMVEVARKYPVDGLHFDYIRYPNSQHCYCDGCRRRFEAQSGQKVSDWPNECCSGARKKEYNDWRCQQITALVAAVSREARKVRPGLKISAAVFGSYPDCRNSIAQDWSEWIKSGYLDFVCPMDYTASDEGFSALVRNQMKLVGGRVPVYPGIGATATNIAMKPDQVLEQIRRARSLGAAGFTIFNFNGNTAASILPAVGADARYNRADYGQRIEGIADGPELWWCEAAWKVAPQRPTPQSTSPAAMLSAARNDREAVQIVLRPSQELKQLTASAGTLTGPDGATIPAENVQVLRVYYHHVKTPSDPTGVSDWWPDALPPLDKPLDLPAGKNQPLWVLIHVPTDAKPGDYAGTIALKAEGWSVAVPIKLHVWNFALPETNHVSTTFGLRLHRAFQYQQVKSEVDKRRVADLYLQSFADHRISPYDPAPLDPIQVKFLPEADPPRAELDFSAFDAAMSRSIEKYHFTNFWLTIEGMGFGDFFGKHSEAQIGEYAEHTPEYQAMFSSYVKQLESHLREKGWLGMAYNLWYDEPQAHYDLIRAGYERIKKYAPGIPTLLTKQPLDALVGPIDIWCILPPGYQSDVHKQRQKHGERYWWALCTHPKAPYCTLFIDHPATDLRVWLWQTWQRGISGILIWQTTHWTSLDEPAQNPYEDPMGYVSGSTPAEKKYWGNGDGRFLYPPLAAATPGASGGKPVIEPPVSSIRLEMLREGIEDYEFLWLLRDLIEKRRPALAPEQVKAYESLLEVPASITLDLKTSTSDPAPIHARRASIAEAIETLAK